MRKSHATLALTALLFSQQLFAADMSAVNSKNPDEKSFKQCENIADACKNAGFARDGGPGKAFWQDCMKPMLLKKSVAGVTVDPKDVKACQRFKIQKLEKQLQQLKSSN